MLKTVVVLLLAYLLGSIPVAYLLVKGAYARDIRRIGSRNVGGMNVARHVSFGLGLLTILLDMGKGILALVLAKYWAGTTVALVLAPVLVIVGDIWPVFLSFRGGKGLAAGFGSLVVINFWVAFWVCLAMGIVVLISRNANLATLVACVLLPFISWWQFGGFGWFFFGLAVALPVFLKLWSPPGQTVYPRFLSH